MTNDTQFVLVTGGSGGLGVAIGLELIKIGLTPILTYNNSLDKIKNIPKSLSKFYLLASKFRI